MQSRHEVYSKPTLAAQRRLSLLALIGVPFLAILGLAAFACWSPSSRFLIPEQGGEWILYPVPPRATGTPAFLAQHTLFKRTFTLPQKPTWSRLRFKPFASCSIKVNGSSPSVAVARRPNEMFTREVTEQLREGENEIEVLVANTVGPPALWLCLDGTDFSIGTDEQWTASLDGATLCAALLAGQTLPFRPGNQLAGAHRTIESFRNCLPTLILFALISAAVMIYFARRSPGRVRLPGRSPLRAALIVVMIAWAILFLHNTFFVPVFPTGFDVDKHLEYIRYIQTNKSLPLADEGFEMHHPPLFYAISALILKVCGLSVHDSRAVIVLRLLGLGIGLAELLLAAACIRRLFPDQPAPQLVGLALAAFLPAHIYVCHYITNESLAMLLCTAAILSCLVILDIETSAAKVTSPTLASGRSRSKGATTSFRTTSLLNYAVLGLCLGAALLTKVTSLVVVGVVFLVLLGGLLAGQRNSSKVRLSGIALAFLTTVLVSGWHYVRVWRHFGSPLVGNYDAASGFAWWQEPGYATLGSLFGFGRALVAPFYSSIASLPDGLYSTLWADGLCGGEPFWKERPPWNYNLMSAGVLLSIVPSAMILVGLITALFRQARKPQAAWFLILGIGGGLVSATYYQYLRYPYSGHAKAIYCLPGLIVLCALGAIGYSVIARLGRVAALTVATLLGTWVCATFASFWIRPDSPVTYTWAGYKFTQRHHPDKALASYRKAVELDAYSIEPKLQEGWLLAQANQDAEARQIAQNVLVRMPEQPEALLLQGTLCQVEQRYQEALRYLRRASELQPDQPLVYPRMGKVLMILRRRDEAIQAFRESLRVNPGRSPADHANLGALLAQKGETEKALAQYQQALSFIPDFPPWNADVAWILATQKASSRLDVEEALRRSQEASHRTDGRDTACLEAYAASLAALDQYVDAVKIAKRAEAVARLSKQVERLPQIEHEIRSYEAKKRYRTETPFRTEPYPNIAPRPSR
jgi:Tfp pilus assembly protein PilF